MMIQKLKMMLAAKKGQATVLRILVIAVLLLVVLSIMIIFFTGKFRLFSKGLVSCEARGGVCKEKPCSEYGMATIKNSDCPKITNETRPYCCIAVE